MADKGVRNKDEQDLQIALIQWCRWYPKLAKNIMYIQNEFIGSAYQHIKAKKMGKVKGASDLFLAIPSKGFHGLWIELKGPNGKLSIDQRDFLEARAEMGYDTCVCFTFEEAKNKIFNYLDNKLRD